MYFVCVYVLRSKWCVCVCVLSLMLLLAQYWNRSHAQRLALPLLIIIFWHRLLPTRILYFTNTRQCHHQSDRAIAKASKHPTDRIWTNEQSVVMHVGRRHCQRHHHCHRDFIIFTERQLNAFYTKHCIFASIFISLCLRSSRRRSVGRLILSFSTWCSIEKHRIIVTHTLVRHRCHCLCCVAFIFCCHCVAAFFLCLCVDFGFVIFIRNKIII